VYSFEEAYAQAAKIGADKCFVIGGASVYKAALPDMDLLYITHVHTEVKEADTFFPVIDPAVWERESTSETHTDPETGYQFEFVVYKKK
ncbi:MAG: dihydrofolate reductase, partial [Bacteroidales bacterium]|nr:dihydrofolate reductase [Bacteroidales bacterium]